jgi:hypothetical protein
MRLLLQASKKSDSEKLNLLRRSISSGSLEMVKLMIGEELWGNASIPWRASLNAAIRTRDIQIIEYLLTLVSPATKNNQTLKIAASSSHEILELVLKDDRIDPMTSLLEVIRHTSPALMKKKLWTSLTSNDIRLRSSGIREGDRDKSTDLLVRDSRVRTELLDSSTIRVIMWILSDFTRDKEDGFNRGNDLVGAELELDELEAIIEDGIDIYSDVLRHLFIKRPNAYELLDWMIEMNDPSLREAARCVARNIMTRKCSSPLRSLLLSIVYPTLSLQELITCLRDEGISRENLILSARLVGAYLGESGIRSRERQTTI